MIIHYPGYYKKFHCLAGECPDTCCIGWEITVDRETEKTYQKLRKGKSELAERLRRSVRRRLIIPDGDRWGCRTSKYFLLGGSPALCPNGIEIGHVFDAILYKRSSFPGIPFGMPYFRLFCFQLSKSMPF